MTPELQNTLAALAQKLGTTVDHLWPLLVAKTKLDAGITVIFCAVLAFGLAYVGYCSYKQLRIERDAFSDAHLGWGLLLGASGIASIILMFAAASSISDFVYPEPAAIQNLINR